MAKWISADAFLAEATRRETDELTAGRWTWQDHEELSRLMQRPPGRTRRSTREAISRRPGRKARAGTLAFAHTGPANAVRAIYADPTYPGWRTKAGPVTVRYPLP